MSGDDKYFLNLGEGDVREVLDKDNLSKLHPLIRDIINYVWMKSGNSDRPKRDLINPNEMKKFLPFVSIMEVVYDNDKFSDIKIRLFGTELVGVYGEVTGSLVSNYNVESVVTRVMVDCQLVIGSKSIVTGSASSVTEEKSFIKLTKVLIPLFDDENDKDKVTQILSLTKFNS